MKKVVNFTVPVIFVIYTLLIFYFTLFDYTFGRNIFNVFNWSATNFEEYAKTSLNVIPFGTVKLMINGLFAENISFKYFIINILGNFFLLTPLGYFIPKLFKGINRFWKFLLVSLGISLSIEILQLLFLTGSCDVDDLILNVLGAVIFYPIFNKFFNKKVLEV